MHSNLFYSLYVTTFLVLTSCATGPADHESSGGRSDDFDASMCNEAAAYEKGFNDASRNKAMNSRFAYGCRVDLKEAAWKGYKSGYEAGRNADALPTRPAVGSTIPAQTPTQAPTQNSGTIINIGGLGGIFGKNPAPTHETPSQNQKAWYCSVKPFMKMYDAFGPTQLEAKQATMTACGKSHAAMHCDDVTCTKNE